MNVIIEKLKIFIPAGLLLFAVIVRWLNLKELEIISNIGLICFAIFQIYSAIKNGYYKRFTLDFLRLLLPIAIIFLALDSIMTAKFNTVGFIITLLFDSMISNRYSNYKVKKDQNI